MDVEWVCYSGIVLKVKGCCRMALCCRLVILLEQFLHPKYCMVIIHKPFSFLLVVHAITPGTRTHSNIGIYLIHEQTEGGKGLKTNNDLGQFMTSNIFPKIKQACC